MSRARDDLLAAAGELFAEHSYGQVTIRDIAVHAGLSPAMVMKCSGSKRELFRGVTTVNPRPLPAVPDSELGLA